MSKPNEVVTQIEGGRLIQLDGTITEADGTPVKGEEAKAEAPKPEPAKHAEAPKPPHK